MDTIYLNVDEHLMMQISSGGQGNMPNMHFHDHYEVYILLEGQRTYIFDDEIVELEKNDVILITPNKIHATGGGEYKRLLFQFDDVYLKMFFTPKASSSLLECFKHKKIHINDIDMNTIKHSIEVLSENNDAFWEFVEILKIFNSYASQIKAGNTNKTVAEIIEYIAHNYMDITGLDEIAEIFYITKEYLCRVFKENTGISIIKYINTKKILDACDLLISTEMTIEEIALSCGFSSSEYFCRIFKNIVGKTAGQYRKSKN